MDKLHVYNTLSRKKELFEPLKPGFVGMYVCGPTVYGDAHLGHAKSYVSFDIIYRYLKYLDYKVRYVQNITDVGHLTDDADAGEDKLLKQSRLERKDPMEIAELYTYTYFRDMDALGVQRPNISPRATGHIPEQIEMIETLITKGHAYASNGNVYFDVTSDKDYGKLSGRNIEEAESGTRVETASDKKNPADFALWKKADDTHIMKWSSPWGVGYPGWHIECSAMSNKYLGETFDIHGGGLENQFPHHECEIAQSECAHDKQFVKYWFHNNMVTLNGQKMGKSLGNAISLQQFFNGNHPLLTRSWSPDIIRFFLLQSHYRSTTDFSEQALEAAESGLKNLRSMLTVIMKALNGTSPEANVNDLKSSLEQCMNDDFNTATAIATLFEKLKPLRNVITNGKIPSNIVDIQQVLLQFVDGVLGISVESKSGDQSTIKALDSVMELVLEIRTKSREQKDWATADLIRNKLTQAGIK
ncbi:MAG TPA: cysteine--tRNA ligase, partial [Bacteroidetes bacterium]|nr:cysteine--tRNA ligase [Bacteroidota bacterium]